MTTDTGTKRAGRLPKGAKTKAKENGEVRPRSDEPEYLDLAVLEEREDPRFFTIQDLILRRRDAKELEKAAIEARKAIDVDLSEIIDKYNVDGIIVDEDTGIDRIVRESAGKWDAKYLKKLLLPDQYAKAWVAGVAS